VSSGREERKKGGRETRQFEERRRGTRGEEDEEVGKDEGSGVEDAL